MRTLWHRFADILLPLAAVGLALLVGAVLLGAMGVSPWTAYAALWQGAFGTPNALAETLVKATPLLLVGLGICIAFQANVINIGGEGQMIVGALVGTWVGLTFSSGPAWLVLPLAMLAGFAGGAVWGGIPGALKAYFGVNEILSTVMMNAIAVQIMNYLLRGPLLDPAQAAMASKIPQTARLSVALRLARWVPTRLHSGALLALLLAIAVHLFLWHTVWGYRLRAVGKNPHAARYAGIPVRGYTVLALLLSGALAGLAGVVQVYGVNYRMITDGSASGFTGNAGFNGIVAALFGGLHPLGTIPAAILFGALLVGANKMQRAVQIPSALVIALNGLVVVFVVSSEIWRRRRQRRRLAQRRDTQAEEADGPPSEQASDKP